MDARLPGHDGSGAGKTKCEIVPSFVIPFFVIPDLIGNPVGTSFPAPTGDPEDGNTPLFQRVVSVSDAPRTVGEG